MSFLMDSGFVSYPSLSIRGRWWREESVCIGADIVEHGARMVPQWTQIVDLTGFVFRHAKVGSKPGALHVVVGAWVRAWIVVFPHCCFTVVAPHGFKQVWLVNWPLRATVETPVLEWVPWRVSVVGKRYGQPWCQLAQGEAVEDGCSST